MVRKIKGLTAVVALLLIAIPTHAEVVPEVTFSAGYTDNLFNDSSSSDDSYTAVSPYLKIYPSSEAEITLSGTYTSYFDYRDLSSFTGRAGLSVIPDLKDSDLHLMFSGSIRGRRYGQLYEAYRNWGANARALFSYVARRALVVRGGLAAGFSEYPNSISGDNDGVNVFIGVNATVVGSNAVNAEIGYGLRRYVTEFEVVEDGRGQNTESRLEGVKNSFQVVDLSLKYSRPLGARTGLSTSYSHRFFVKEADSVVYGFTIDYLSPWASMWDGPSIGAQIKHFPGLDFIVETGFSYSDKEYTQNLDMTVSPDPDDPDTPSVDLVLNQRSDKRSNIFLRLQRPISTSTRRLIKPTIEFSWTDNESNMPLYDYSCFDISFSLWVRF